MGSEPSSPRQPQQQQPQQDTYNSVVYYQQVNKQSGGTCYAHTTAEIVYGICCYFDWIDDFQILIEKAIKIGAKQQNNDGKSGANTPEVIRELIKYYYQDKITILQEGNQQKLTELLEENIIDNRIPIALSMKYCKHIGQAVNASRPKQILEQQVICDCSQKAGHAVVIVGVNLDNGSVKIKNSWGQNWMDKGYCYMSIGALAKVNNWLAFGKRSEPTKIVDR